MTVLSAMAMFEVPKSKLQSAVSTKDGGEILELDPHSSALRDGVLSRVANGAFGNARCDQPAHRCLLVGKSHGRRNGVCALGLEPGFLDQRLQRGRDVA